MQTIQNPYPDTTPPKPMAMPHAQTPRTPRAAPAPPLATLRYTARRAGRPEVYPKGRPHPLQVSSVDPAPPEIGRGSKRASPTTPESLTASCEAAGEPHCIKEPPVIRLDPPYTPVTVKVTGQSIMP